MSFVMSSVNALKCVVFTLGGTSLFFLRLLFKLHNTHVTHIHPFLNFTFYFDFET